MIRCIAIDDEPLALSQLSGYILKVPFLQLVKSCNSALEALKLVSSTPIDLIFTDINMPDLNGMDFVKSLTNKPMIIFTTAYSEYAVESFRIDVLDYLLKPFGYSDFLKAANKALIQYELLEKDKSRPSSLPKQESSSLYVKADYKMIRLDINTILYLESQNEYVRIYSENQRPIMTLASMKALEEQLPANKFMRVHRSYIINLQKIIAVTNNRILYGKDIYIPIGNQYKEKFNNYLKKHSLGKI
ncbi:LytTR family DNA-binding domain-containing protein [Parabacteroides sp. AM08-6]|uniref:LytR/AlgR family response regulator transcription factor n=1 Tax=Parabacteroides sp. AM08-6 TaxID=2292053 RepID=UPI000F006468|nr:LytTR family DNA-binding domain-containing protein [Parabacteroides sp. AM08-6]RHJ83457.1 DNA-binding response regulator [Parabacteroides sp. AM08-6]